MKNKPLILWLIFAFALAYMLLCRAYSAEYTAKTLADKLCTLGVNSPNIGRIAFNPVEAQDLKGWCAGAEQKFTSRDNWRCSDYADTLFVFAKSRDIKAAIGVIWFYIHPEAIEHEAHAVNIFISKDGAFRFFDAKRGCEVSLTKEQIASIYYVLF